jgi:uncharacterized membrane protein (UPF0127 family)
MMNGSIHIEVAPEYAMNFRTQALSLTHHVVYLWLLIVFFSILAAPAVQGAQPPSQFEQEPVWIETAADRFEFQVEIAATPAQRSRGLMFREHLAADRGMLFDFERPQPVTMWMRNTLISLDMLFVRDDGRISRIVAETEPLSDRTIGSGEPVRAVLELRGGRAAELGIRPGDRLIHPLFDQ